MTPPGLLYARGLSGTAVGLRLRHEDGRTAPVPLERWLGPLRPADHAVLDRATGPVLDVGCGPGRHVAALRRRGVDALGLDVSPTAVRTARRRGAPAIERCVFDDVPRVGRWGSVLLLDGNVGIGGRPATLLRRAAELAAPDGVVLVELDPPGSDSGRVRIRLEDDELTSAWFPWAHVAADAIDAVARRADLHVTERFQEEDRWFCALAAA